MKNMTPANQRLREIYCIECPQKCAINQARASEKPVPITLLFTAKLQLEKANIDH